MFSNVQIIRQEGEPAFVVIPYAEFVEVHPEIKIEDQDEQIKFPLEVSMMHNLRRYSLIKAWRIYRGKTQKEMAALLNISQAAYSMIERSEHPQISTIRKIAPLLGVECGHLTLDD